MKHIQIQSIDPKVQKGFDVSHFQIDSRIVGEGDLFFSISGKTFDGHHFLKEVASRGASGAVVTKKYSGPSFGLHLIRVDNVEEYLQKLARDSLKTFPVTVIGVTGSVGKTTTKDLIATLLEGKYRVEKTVGSQNTKLTVPLTILNRSKDIEVLVLEMGMSEMGDLKRLVSIAPPTIAVLTKVALVHAEFFPEGLPQIARAKGEIFSHPETKLAIFDRDCLQYVDNVQCEKETFSKDDLPEQYSSVFKEEHFQHNLAASLLVCKKMGLSEVEILNQIPKLKLPKMRFEQFENNGVHFINDAYNAGPESMKASLKEFGKIRAKGKKIAVLGSMKELGHFSESAHREVGEYALQRVDYLLAIGIEAKPLFEAFYKLNKSAEFFLDRKELGSRLKELIQEGDAVLIKGSRSLEMEKILDELNSLLP